MKNLFIMGYPDSGKTMITLGLALKFRELGYRVGYFKPVDSGRKTPSGKIPGGDAVLMKNILQMDAPVGIISPAKATPTYLTDVRGGDIIKWPEIKSSYDEIAEDCDVVLIEGAINPYAMSAVELDSVTLAKNFNAPILLVTKAKDDYDLDLAMFYSRVLQDTNLLAGLIFSNVPRLLLDKTQHIFKPIIEKAGYKSLGIIPANPNVSFPTVGEYRERLGADVLVGHEYLERPVENVVVGAMTMESALTYLRRSANKAVVIGGDRADLALSALETSTSALVLTGGLYPNVQVLARAGEKAVPVILSHMDTYSVIEAMGQVARHLKPSDTAGIDIALENINQHCDWPHLEKVIGLKK